MLFRWFVGLGMDAPVYDVTVFTKNRDRRLRGEVAGRFFAVVLRDLEVKPLVSAEHFSLVAREECDLSARRAAGECSGGAVALIARRLMRSERSRMSQARRRRRLWPAAARTTLTASPAAPARKLRPRWPWLFMCPITGSCTAPGCLDTRE
jgi:hypothetical protein